MKWIVPVLMILSLNTFAEETSKAGSKAWDKTKKVINTTADKIDSGTRTVIKKAKTKMNEKEKEKVD